MLPVCHKPCWNLIILKKLIFICTEAVAKQDAGEGNTGKSYGARRPLEKNTIDEHDEIDQHDDY